MSELTPPPVQKDPEPFFRDTPDYHPSMTAPPESEYRVTPVPPIPPRLPAAFRAELEMIWGQMQDALGRLQDCPADPSDYRRFRSWNGAVTRLTEAAFWLHSLLTS